MPASASLIGDSVFLLVTTQTGQGLFNGSAVVGDGAEYLILGDQVELDFDAESVTIRFLQTRPWNFRVNAQSLDWRDDQGELIDGEIVGLNFPGFEPSFSSFTEHQFLLDPGSPAPTFQAGESFVIELITAHSAPEPTTIALAAVGTLSGFAAARRRRGRA